MATAWEILVGNSTLPEFGNDAWEHLNAQDGSGECPDGIVLIDGLRILLDNNAHSINIIDGKLLINVDQGDINTTIDQGGLITNVDQGDITVDIPPDEIDVLVKCGSTLVPKEQPVSKRAGENIGGLRCLVTDTNGDVFHASVARVLAGREVIGVSMTAAAVGTFLDVAQDGDEIIESSWNWEMDKPIFVTEYGHMTQVVPTENYNYMVALPLTPTSIVIRIEPPIFF